MAPAALLPGTPEHHPAEQRMAQATLWCPLAQTRSCRSQPSTLGLLTWLCISRITQFHTMVINHVMRCVLQPSRVGGWGQLLAGNTATPNAIVPKTCNRKGKRKRQRSQRGRLGLSYRTSSNPSNRYRKAANDRSSWTHLLAVGGVFFGYLSTAIILRKPQ